MQIFRKLGRLIRGATTPPDDGPPLQVADEVDFTVPAGNAGEIHIATASIDQILPLGSAVSGDFTDNALPIAVLQRFNNTPGLLEFNLYYFQNIAGGTFAGHYVMTRHAPFL